MGYCEALKNTQGFTLFHLEKDPRSTVRVSLTDKDVTEICVLFKAWTASSSGDKEPEFGIGIAMLVCCILPPIQIVNNGDSCICTDDNTGNIEICSKLIYLGEPGDKAIIREFFEFGVVSWLDPVSVAYCGGYFVATLSSLQFGKY
ncbi:uncharacterized protein LOC113291780 [Papaver somniferum]|uniref:uncharacterized protein LOC113291780 n=1 Tax=Papaver somniferum TaxID=3469 RepID=UPI000E6F4701|nr:uncharacterized protein LOC113291780 [Papaver somniferum]